jgi:putative lipoprotein
VIDLDKLANGKAIETSVRVVINPTNNGIKAGYQLTENTDEAKNQVIISGKPMVKGNISVDVQWGIYGNMSYSPKLFKKRFIINVVE